MAATHDATAASVPASAEAPSESMPGFAVRLPCAQLGDLIQINCINRVRGAFRVSSGEHHGHLFFEGGQLVHAACGEQVGLDAVVVMLGWRGGSIEPSELGEPEQVSIGMGADALLLHAAQRVDEQARDSMPSDATTKVVRRVAWPEEAAHRSAAPSAERRRETSGIALSGRLPFEGMDRLEVTRVASDGNIERLTPGASTDLADTAFYCQRLASLVGEGLGLGPCRALASESAHEGLVVFQGRSIVGARGQRNDLQYVLAKVGLG